MDPKLGATLVLLALILLPTTMMTLDQWDRSEMEYKKNCDSLYRVMTNVFEPIDNTQCDELLVDKVTNLRIFLLTLSGFMVSGLMGLIIILPYSDDEPESLN